MQKLTSPPRADDQLRHALDTCCGALRSLEVARVQAAQEEDDERQRHITRAIELLRGAIAELQSLSEGDLNAAAAGFVLPGDPRPGNDEG